MVAVVKFEYHLDLGGFRIGNLGAPQSATEAATKGYVDAGGTAGTDLHDSALADLTALRSAITAITAKLDADAGVTGTDYAATCNPAALVTT